jgi:hypothetical protein
MAQYDSLCRRSLKGKIPDLHSTDFRKRVGDCIYDFSDPSRPRLRASVHDEGNRFTDLGGLNAIISRHFYYFGNKAIALPPDLVPIVHQTQGHKSHANSPYVSQFVSWIESSFSPNEVCGEPQLKDSLTLDPGCRSVCAGGRRDDAVSDEEDESRGESARCT